MKHLIAALLFIVPLSAQVPFQVLYSEVFLFPSDSSSNLFYTYKIPYNRLVFEKVKDSYEAGFNISIEIADSAGASVSRQIVDEELTAADFEQTDSEKLYLEGVIKFIIKEGSYTLKPVLTDRNSGREIKLKEFTIKSSDFSSFNFPLVVNTEELLCNNSKVKSLTNYEGNIPFSEKDFDLVIPAADSLEKIKIEIINNKDTVLSKEISEYYYSDFNLLECDNRIVFKSSEKTGEKYFLLPHFTKKFAEGNIRINIYKNLEEKPYKTFNKEIRWFNKPTALNKAEFAIKMLKYIEKDEVIKNLLSEDEDDYPEVLFNYWKKYDPTPESAYNQLMEEYYERVDYSARNFSTLTGKSGVETDRGKVFIQFGEPKQIERSSNKDGKIVETWIYNKNGRRFVFVDEKGTGDFALENG